MHMDRLQMKKQKQTKDKNYSHSALKGTSLSQRDLINLFLVLKRPNTWAFITLSIHNSLVYFIRKLLKQEEGRDTTNQYKVLLANQL